MAQKNDNNAYAEMQTATQEAQNINSERLRNVALEKQDQLNNSNNMQVMAEAGGILANDIGPSTAATLGKYGFPKTQRTQGREVKVKPNNITIVNNNITTTTNNVTGGGGNNKVDDGPAKFKTWVSNAFARQKEESSRREKEYNKREWSLSKSANKMLRKMEGASREVANTFNPKNIGTTVGNQMKMLLMLFGVRFLAKHWTSVLDGLSWIYKKVSQFVAFLGFGEEGARLKRTGDDITGKIVSLFGGDPRSSDKSKSTIIGLFGKLLNDFRDHIKLWFEKQMALRGEAMKSIQFPTLDFGGSSDGGIVGGIVNGLGNVFSKAFSGVTEYLGNILTVLADPKAGAIKGLQTSLKNDSLSRASEYRIWEAKNGGPSEFTNHGEVNSGDYSLFETRNGRRKNTLLSDAVDDSGRLNGTAGASISQGRDILGAIQVGKDFGYVDTARVASGLERLYASSQEDGAIVDRDFLNTIFGATQHNLISSGKIQPVEMKFVEEKMTSSDKARENEYAVQVHGSGSTMKGLMGNGGTADMMSMLLFGTGNASTLETIGRVGKDLYDQSIGRIPNAIKGYREASAREGEMKNKKYILVPASDPRPEAVIDGKRPGKQTLYKLTPEALQFAGKNFGLDGKQGLTSENYETFLPGVEKWLINRSGGQAAMDRAWKSKGQSAFRGRSQRVDYSDALKGIRRLSDIEKAYDTRLANDAWSQDVAGISNNFRELGNSAVHAMGEGMEWIGEGISAIASRSSGKKGNVSTAELHNRQNYLMKLFTERGMSPAAAAGIIGNLTCEALFVKDTGHQYPDGKAWSAGIAGFYRYGEWPSLEKWARENGKDWRKFETQAEYIAQHPKFLQIARETVGMNDKQAMVHAANMWAYRFEKFAGFDPKKSNYRPQEYRKRQGMAAGILQRVSGINVQDLQFDSASLGTVPSGSSQSSVQSFSVSYSGSSIGEVSQGKIVLVGDSYAAGMASSFKANVKSKGREAEATVATQRECNEKATNKCCVSGATIERIGLQAQHALSFSPAVMVIHAGLNNSGESENSLTNKLVSCGSIPKSKGVQVFLIAPITNQTGKFNSGRNSGNAAKVARAVRSACKSAGYGLIDLEPTNSIYEGKFDGEGIHPKNYSQYAKDTVELLFKGGGLATAAISSDGSYVGSDGFPVYGDGGVGSWFMETGATLQGSNPFGETSSTQEQIKSMKIVDKAGEIWNKYTDLLSSSFTFKEFTNWWIGQSESLRKRHELTLTNLSKEEIMKAVKADPKAGVLSTRQLLEGLGYRSTGEYNRLWHQWIANNQYNMRSEFGTTWSKDKDNRNWLKEISGYSEEYGTKYNRHGDIISDGKKISNIDKLIETIGSSGKTDSEKYKDIYDAVFEANEKLLSSKYYNNKIGAGILFGKYQELDKKRKELEERASKGEIDITSYEDETGRTRYNSEEYDQVMSRLDNYEKAAYNYTTNAKGQDKEGRQRTYEATNKFLNAQDEYQSLFDSNKKWIEDATKELERKALELGGVDSEEFKKYKENWDKTYNKIQNEYTAKRESLFSAMGDLSKFVDSETLSIFRNIQDENLAPKKLQELQEELKSYIDGGDSSIDAINKMVKVYGEGMLEKIQNEVLGINPIFGEFKLQEDDFTQEKFQNLISTLENNIQSAVTPDSLQPLFFQLKDLETHFQALVGLNSAGFLNFDPTHADIDRVALKLMTRWDDVQQIETRTRPFGTAPSKEFIRVSKTYDRTTDKWNIKTENLKDYMEGVQVGFGQLPQGTGNAWKTAVAKAGESLENATSDFLFNMASQQMNSFQTQMSDYMTGLTFTPTTYNFSNIFNNPSSTGFVPQSATSLLTSPQTTEFWLPVLNTNLISNGIFTYNGKRYPVRQNPTTGIYEYNSGVGYAEGGYTSPGAKYDESGVVHAGEWVAPAWMVKDPTYSPLISLLEKSRVTKKAGMEIASSEKIDNSEVVSKLNHLIQIASQGNEYAALNIKATSEGLSGVSNVIANKPVAIQNTTQRTRSVKSLTR